MRYRSGALPPWCSRGTHRQANRAWRTARTAVITLFVSIAAVDVSLGAPLVGAPTAEPLPVSAVADARVKLGVAPTVLAHPLAASSAPDPFINSLAANETASWAAPRLAAAAAACAESAAATGGLICEPSGQWATRKAIYLTQTAEQAKLSVDAYEDDAKWWLASYKRTFSCAAVIFILHVQYSTVGLAIAPQGASSGRY